MTDGRTAARLAPVVHATRQPNRSWLVGCRFCPSRSDAEVALAVQQCP